MGLEVFRLTQSQSPFERGGGSHLGILFSTPQGMTISTDTVLSGDAQREF